MSKKRATIRDVAKKAGVAPITVSRVINNSGYISDDTRVRVEKAIEELQYIPNSLSRSFRQSKTNTVALIVSDITNPFWTTVTRGAEDECSKHGLNLILCNSDEKEHKLENYINVLLQKQTDGFLLVPTSQNTDIICKIQKQNVPVVLLDRYLKGVEVDMVRSDSISGSFELTEHLIKLGHRCIAIIVGPKTISTSLERIEGYRKAMNAYEIPIDESIVIYGEYTQESGYEMAYRIINEMEPRPTAIFCGNNFIAYGVLKALDEMDTRVPQDISIVSFDDLSLRLLPSRPFLTVAAQQAYELGEIAARLLIERISGERTSGREEVLMPVKMIVRNSSGKVSQSEN